MSSIDKRVKHTKQFLKEALIELLKEKPLSKISITELCKKADINRNTFYCHYNYPEEILIEMQEEIFHQFQKLFNENKNESSLILNICRILKESPRLYYITFNSSDGRFLEQLISLSHDKNIYDWKKITEFKDSRTAEMFYRFMLSGATSIIRTWCDNGFKETPEEISQFIIDLSLYGMKGIIK